MDSFNENKAVGQLAEIVALERGYAPAKARQIRIAGFLHDIGKQRIVSSIIDKPGTLTAREFEIIKTHTKLGAAMLLSIQGELGEMARACCELHHEWHDGSQSYWGHRAADLPAYIGIVSICDVFTALCSTRCYKKPWPPDDALEYIQNKAGTQFCPELAGVFIPLVQKDSRVPAIFTGIQAQNNNTQRREST